MMLIRGHRGVAIAIAALLALSILFRWPDFREDIGAPDIEASYHVLLTVHALEQSPAREHHFLPIVSFGRAVDRDIPFSLTVPIAGGHHVYTSFGAPLFLAPLGFFKLFGLPTTLSSLILFNLLLQGIACAALAVLLRRLLSSHGVTGWRADLGIVAGVALQIFSAEALLSYGVVYWAQQIYQSVLIVMLILLDLLIGGSPRRRPALLAIGVLAILAFAGPLLEWTGFVFNLSAAALLLMRSRDRRHVGLALLLVAMTMLATAAFIGHFASAMGYDAFMDALESRFLVRTATTLRGPFDLLVGYVISYGLLIPLIFGATALLWRAAPPRSLRLSNMPLFIALCAAAAALENIVMLQHAAQFSFDRLKPIIPAAIAIAFVVPLLGRRALIWCGGLLLLAFVQNVAVYRYNIASRASWTAIDHRNRAMEQRIATLVDMSCAVLASDNQIRGYAMMLFDRGVYEHATPASFAALAASERARRCGAVYLHDKPPFLDMPDYRQALVHREGHAYRIVPGR